MQHVSAKFCSILLMLFAGLTFSLTAQDKQQNRNQQQSRASDLYVVSAKAGGVNYVSGKVQVKRSSDGKTQILAKKDELTDLDKVLTGETGKLEVLLNPGSFLRMAENSEVEFTDLSSDDLKLALNRGSALIEATTFDKDGAGIVLATPAGQISFAKSGVYRINVLPDNAVAISVWKGAAKTGNTIIKAKRKIVLRGNAATEDIAKLEKENRDDFELWSKDRAKELVKLNENLRQRELSRALIAYNSTGFGASGNSFGSSSSGAWVFDRFRGSYCFLPFYAGAWSSPYGFGYNNYAWMPGSAGANNGAVVQPQVISQPTNGGMPNFPGGGGNGGAATPSSPMPTGSSPGEMRSLPSRIMSKGSPTNPD